ncbi:thermonuclease family protein [Nesterenkonia alba]|uniref:thermonuclease family protein n=1 Tax=Nesterenkonia alba TaxID=515814 RepID=UPI0003B58328|nr:thermonuclease family protein [Nesterenkonia alba]
MKVPNRFIVWTAVLVVVCVAAAAASWWQQHRALAEGDYRDGQVATLVRVIDGDTIVVDVDGVEERVRLLNIDTPESVHPDQPVECLGPESSLRLEQLIQPGDQVSLEFDLDQRDHYGRLLAAVHREDLFINEQMARDGYGAPIYFPPNERFLPEIIQAWEEAQTAGAGVFAEDLPCDPEIPALP